MQPLGRTDLAAAENSTIGSEQISIDNLFAQTFDIATRGHRLDLLGLSVAKLYCVTLGNGDWFTQRPVCHCNYSPVGRHRQRDDVFPPRIPGQVPVVLPGGWIGCSR